MRLDSFQEQRLEIPGSTHRLDRILSLIQSCQFSIHDLSGVQLDRYPPATPRFNMPFELGLTVGSNSHRAASAHVWFVFERVPWRLQKSLSDLNGTGVYKHSNPDDSLILQVFDMSMMAARYIGGCK